MSRCSRGNSARTSLSDVGGHPEQEQLMSTATKRGKLLPDLLVAREALLPSIAHGSPGRETAYADLDVLMRSRPGVLKWVLVRRIEGGAIAEDPPRPQNSNVPGQPVRQRRAAAKASAEAIFCEKGDAIPAVARPWCWEYENLAETSLKSAACGRRAKSKTRQNSA